MNYGDKVFFRKLAAALGYLSRLGRLLLVKHLIERGPVTLSEAVDILGGACGSTAKLSPKTVLRELRIMAELGLVRQEEETWRIAQSCVANAVRRALVPKRTVFILSDGRCRDSIEGVYASRGGAEAEINGLEELGKGMMRHSLACSTPKDIEEYDVCS